MTTNYSVGGNAESWCAKCKSEREHTITSMVGNAPKKVICNICNAQHNFRSKPSKKSRAKPKISTRKSKSQEMNYEECISLLTDNDIAKAKKYSMQGNFKTKEIINHPAFGIGIVLSVVQIKKIEVLFEDEPKLLVQNQ